MVDQDSDNRYSLSLGVSRNSAAKPGLFQMCVRYATASRISLFRASLRLMFGGDAATVSGELSPLNVKLGLPD